MDTHHPVLQLSEPIAIADTFVSGVGCVEELAPNLYRVTYFANQKFHYGSGEVEKVVVAKFIVTLDTLLAMSNATTARQEQAAETAGLPASSLN